MKPIPFITEYCPHCFSDVEIKGTMRWHKCPICGNYIKPCAACNLDKTKCENCPLNDKPKPIEKIGSHIVERIMCSGDYIALYFEKEDTSSKYQKTSGRVIVFYFPENDEFVYNEECRDLHGCMVGVRGFTNLLTEHEIVLVKRKLRKVARNLEL